MRSQIKMERRDGDEAVAQGRLVASLAQFRFGTAETQPVIGIAATVLALVNPEPVRELALGGDLHALHLFRSDPREVDVQEHAARNLRCDQLLQKVGSKAL